MFIALDIGGTTSRVAPSYSLKKIALGEKFIFQNTNNFTIDAQNIIDQIRRISQEKINGICIGFAGQINSQTQEILNAPNLSTWNHMPLVKKLEQAFVCPVLLYNDSVTGGSGEAAFGDYNISNFVYLIWGTGIGGSCVIKTNDSIDAKQLLPWEDYFEDWENECGGRKIQEHFKINPNSLSVHDWNSIESLFAKHLEKFLNKTHIKHIVVSGGVALHNKDKVKEIENMFDKKISLTVSSLGESANLLGAFYLLQKYLNS